MRKQSQRRKHIPQRTCLACRQVRPKRDLVRLVRTPTGEILLDETGKLNGRGAYLCRHRRCWESALTQHKLEKTLKTSLPPETQARLLEFMIHLPDPLSEPSEDRE